MKSEKYIVEDIKEIIKKRILLLDGAMGTMLQSYGLTEEDFRGEAYRSLPGLLKGNNDALNVTRPDIVEDVHRRYLEAGCDIIETNTFSCQRISMSDYNMESYCTEMISAGCSIARRLADEYTARTPWKPRFVAGSIGPTNKSCTISPDVNDPSKRSLTFDELASAYSEQVTALLHGGVDLLLFETIFDTLNCKAGLYAARKSMDKTGIHVPIMLSVTVSDAGGRTLSGQTLGAFLASVGHSDIFSVGLNCSFGAHQMYPFLKELSDIAPYYISVYPNAGLPNSLGQYDQTPSEMAQEMRRFVDEGLVNIIGGCCGTTDTFISEFAKIIVDASGNPKHPHTPACPSTRLQLAGLELLDVRPDMNFINVGERCNVAGSRKFLRLVNEKNYDEALSIARKQVEDGAQILDINMDDGLLDSKHEMVTFLNLLMSDPDISRVPLMIDSSDWSVILAGLKCVQGKCIVNSISLKEGKSQFVEHANEIKELGAAVVVMAFDEEGQATTFARKISICERSYHILVDEVGMNPSDIIFDPNVLAVATGIEEHNTYALDFIRATSWIRQNLPGAHVSGGISNLSFSFRGNNYIREAMHAVFLYHTIEAGQDIGIVNPATKIQYSDIPKDVLAAIDDVLFNRRDDATERLVEIADRIKEESVSSASAEIRHDSWRDGTSVEERLETAMVKGIKDYLETDLAEAMTKYGNAVSIIEGPLMSGMNKVGELFGSGKMFLPQVVKTARTMKSAVSILQPYIESSRQNQSTKSGKILLATVKGDVHDIGKNIVGLVLSCNNYEVIDLGVMVPAEEIVHRAKELEVDIIGLSGLITPSLEEMVNVARELQRQGMDIPLMIGGATTSDLHTALKISPVYHAPILWMHDASQNVLAANRLVDSKERKLLEEELYKKNRRLLNEYEISHNQKEALSIDEARQRRWRPQNN